MVAFHVIIAYDFDTDESDSDVWEKFKEKYKPLLFGDEENYPESTAVLKINAETRERAIQKAEAKIWKWINEIEEDGTKVSISKLFIARCYDEKFYE